MTRPLRVNIENGWYHVMCRGIEHRPIFLNELDRTHFLDLLAEVHERFRFVIHTYVQMEGHYHLIVQTPDANLSRGMQWLQLSYSAWFNARHGRVGPLFQGRFKSVPVENSAWAYELSLYIHLNPLRGGKGVRSEWHLNKRRLRLPFAFPHTDSYGVDDLFR